MSVVVSLDVGDKRIGVAVANTLARVAHPHETIDVNGAELARLVQLMGSLEAEGVVIGLPRNMEGAETKQTHKVRDFAHQLGQHLSIPISFQDESLTSVEAERRLEEHKKPFTKGDIDKEAAAIILQDYLDEVVR